jgi:hypothetical protein
MIIHEIKHTQITVMPTQVIKSVRINVARRGRGDVYMRHGEKT